MKEKAKKTVSIVVNVLVWVFLAFALVMMVFSLSSAANSNGMPELFGKSFISVQSDSMKPTFEKGDLIICKVYDHTKQKDAEKLSKLKVGDVITMREDLNGDGVKEFKSHRIIAIWANGEKVTDDNGNVLAGHETYYLNNVVYYETKGDNAKTNPTADTNKVIYTDVLCVWNDGDAKLDGVGSFLDFVGSKKGFLLIIVLPLGVFFLYEVYNLIFIVVQIRQRKTANNAPVLDEEEIKRKAIEEYLRQEELKKQAVEEYKKQHGVEETAEIKDENENVDK